MKTNKLISLILTAALALSACASAANSATAAAPAETAAATPEPTAAPEPVGELHALAETGQNKFGNVICQTRPALDDEGNFTGTVIYKTDPDARQTTALYEYNDSAYSTLYQFLANDTLYVVMYRYDSDTKLLAVPLDGGEVWEIPLGPIHMGCQVCMHDRYVYCMSYSQAPTSPTCGMRLDLKTGASEKWDIAHRNLRCTRRDRWRHCHKRASFRTILSHSRPIPEMLSAILQNSTL